MAGLRRAIGILQYLNKELVRGPEAIICSARVPQSHPRPGVPAVRDAHPVILDALIPMVLVQPPAGVMMFDTELRIVWVNDAAVRLNGGTPATRWPGRRPGEVLPCMDTDLIERSLRRVLATREPAVGLEVSSRGGDCGPDGDAMHFTSLAGVSFSEASVSQQSLQLLNGRQSANGRWDTRDPSYSVTDGWSTCPAR